MSDENAHWSYELPERTRNALFNQRVLEVGITKEEFVKNLKQLHPTPQGRASILLRTRGYGRKSHKQLLDWLSKNGHLGLVNGPGHSFGGKMFGFDTRMTGVLFRGGMLKADDDENSFRERLIGFGPRLEDALFEMHGYGPGMHDALMNWLGEDWSDSRDARMAEVTKDLEAALKEIKVLRARLRRIADIASV